MSDQLNRRYFLFLCITLILVWGSGYVQREIRTFHKSEYRFLDDFKVYYTAGLVARSDSDRRLYAITEVPDVQNGSGSVVINPQLQPPDPNSTFARYDIESNSQLQYLYPPPFAIAAIPFTYLSFENGSIVWHVLLSFFLIVAIFCCVSIFVDDLISKLVITVLAFAVIETSVPVQDFLLVGNIGSIIACLCAIGLFLHKRNPTLGALFFALATAIKLTPIAVLPLMIVRKQWNWTIAFSLWLALIFGISIVTLGFDNHYEFVTKVMPAMAGGLPVDQNRSLSTFVHAIYTGRFLIDADILSPKELRDPTIPDLTFKVLTLFAFASLFGFLYVRKKINIVLEVAVVLVCSVIFSPISFRHYYALAIVPVVIAWLHCAENEDRIPVLAALSAGTVMVLSVVPSYFAAASESFVVDFISLGMMPAGALLLIYVLLFSSSCEDNLTGYTKI